MDPAMITAGANAANAGSGMLNTLFGSTPGTAQVVNSKTKNTGSTSTEASMEALMQQLQTLISNETAATSGTETNNTNATGTSSNNSDMAQLMAQLTEMQGSTTTSNLDSAQMQQLNEVMATMSGRLNGDNTQFSKEAAISDSANASQAALDRVISSGIGTVFDAGTNTGSYNSTAQQNIANELGAEATRVGTQVTLDQINKYAGLSQQQQGADASTMSQLLSNAINAGGTTTTNQSTNTDQNSSSSENSTAAQTNQSASTNTNQSTTATNTNTSSNTSQSSSEDATTSTETETDSETDNDYDVMGGTKSLASQAESGVRNIVKKLNPFKW